MAHVDLLELQYFEGISLDDMVSLVDLMQPRQFKKGATIVSEGDATPPPLYIATTGRVQISKRGNDGERPLAELDSPTLFGEIELFCQLPPVATARALTDVACFALTRDTFEELFRSRHPGLLRFTFNVARVACHRLAIADEIMARVLANEDVVRIRRAVFAAMSQSGDWPNKTGAFRNPLFRA